MLITTELCRDILCNELIQASNAAKANVMSDVMLHLQNMRDILMSQCDMVHVEVDTWQDDLTDIAKEIVERKGHG